MSDTTQVLTFALGEEECCVPIEFVAEIVANEQIKTVPNTEQYVEGVADLRGKTTTILDPRKVLSVQTQGLLTDGCETGNRIIVLDKEVLDIESPTGWLVSDVREVNAVSASGIDEEAVADSDCIRGLLKSDTDDRFTIWLEPQKLT